MYSTTRRALLGGAALVGASALCFAATSLKGCLDRAASSVAVGSEETGVSIEGLPVGVELAAQPYEVKDGYALFSDRVVRLIQPTDEAIGQLAAAQAGLFGLVPEGVRAYLAMAPTRAMFEDSLRGQTCDEQAVIDALYAQAPANVACVDVFRPIEDHRGEYLYFRTDPWWTMRGAYYAARALTSAARVWRVDIEACDVDERVSFRGGYRNQSTVELPADRLELYALRGQSNQATIYKRELDGEGLYCYDAPVTAVSRRGTDVFFDGTISHALVKGDGDPERAILVYGSPCARVLAPWLISSFGSIVFVDASWHRLSRTQFQELCDVHRVTDFAVIQTAGSLMTNVETNRMLRLTREG